MKILAIEASSAVASVAILTDDIITAEYTINNRLTHSQTLLPMIDEVCRMTETDVADFDAIAVSSGPGSFTGLRIGSATAKGLAQALGIPIIHVPTLEAMAYNYYGTNATVCPIMDARRNQVYTGVYYFRNNKLMSYMEGCAISADELLDFLNEAKLCNIVFVGDGIPVFRQHIDEKADFEHNYAPAGMNRQRASSVALLGAEYLKEGRTETADAHLPDYFRKSQAEREREGKLAGKDV